LHNSVKDKLARDQVVASMIVRLVRSVEIAQIAKTAGLRLFLYRHGAQQLLIRYHRSTLHGRTSRGHRSICRVPSIAPHYISRALDGGALGVIAPHIRSARDARGSRSRGEVSPLAIGRSPAAASSANFVHFAEETIQALTRRQWS